MSSATTTKMIVLKSSDGHVFEIEEAVILQSQTIKHMIEDDCADNIIPLPNVTGGILAKVIEYCKRHANDKDNDDLNKFDKELVEADFEYRTLFDLMLAANYLDIKSLLDLTCQTVADKIKGLSPEKIRQIFNIKNDFTEEEEAQVRAENAWAFEPDE